MTVGLPAFKSVNQPLQQPIETSEVNSPMKKLNNARACGYDSLPGELLKYAANQLDASLAAIFNQALEHGQPLELGRGILEYCSRCLESHAIGALSSLRPIVLLTTLCKVLSLVVLSQISNKVNSSISAGQSGF